MCLKSFFLYYFPSFFVSPFLILRIPAEEALKFDQLKPCHRRQLRSNTNMTKLCRTPETQWQYLSARLCDTENFRFSIHYFFPKLEEVKVRRYSKSFEIEFRVLPDWIPVAMTNFCFMFNSRHRQAFFRVRRSVPSKLESTTYFLRAILCFVKCHV